MQIHKNEVTTGILVLVSGAILIGVLAVLGAPGLIKPLNTYKIYYDNAGGIRPGGPVMLAGREIGKVTRMESPVAPENRPPSHPDFEVAIEVQVERKAQIYQNVTVHLTQQTLMGQQVIDFVHGDPSSGLAPNHAEFAGERVPDLSEAVSKQMKQLTGPGSNLSETLHNAEQMTDTLKREPWRLIWPSKKEYGDEKEKDVVPKKSAHENAQTGGAVNMKR
jgi:hypothetical protein